MEEQTIISQLVPEPNSQGVKSKKIIIFVGIIILLIALAGSIYFIAGKKDIPKTYTLSEVSLHSSKNDCWLAVSGNVYDVTQYIKSEGHPGGEEILRGCGKDATSLYTKRDPKGDSHSQQAASLLENFKIGTLVQ